MNKRKPQVNVALDPVKDKDIIDFLDGSPKSWLIKQAIRSYMGQEKSASVRTNESDHGTNGGDDLPF